MCWFDQTSEIWPGDKETSARRTGGARDPYLKTSRILDNCRKNKTFSDIFPASISKRMSVYTMPCWKKPNSAQQCQFIIQTGGDGVIFLYQNEIYNIKEIGSCSMTEVFQNTGAQTKEILCKRLSQRFRLLGVGCCSIFTSTSSRCRILFTHSAFTFQTLHC